MNISVIIPVYRVERFIERCIRSVIDQTFTTGVECIIVDDCTPDRSMEIVKRIVSEYTGNIQFKLLYHKINGGSSKARNTGLDEACGDYITQLDSDDYVGSDLLERMYLKAVDENADIVVADYFLTYTDRDEYISQVLPSSKERIIGELIQGKFKGSFSRGCCNKLIRRSLYTVGNVRYPEGISYNEDLLAMLPIFWRAEKVVHLPEAFYHYVQYNDSSYCSTVSLKMMEDRINANIVIGQFLSDHHIIGCEKDFAYKKLSDKTFFLFGCKGKLQRHYNDLYKEAHRYKVSFLKEWMGRGLYWKVALFCAFSGCLPVYNLMRNFWRWIRKGRVNVVLLEE